MQSNNNNNEQNWRQRLDDFEASPTPDLNASWEKLQQRSPVKKENSRKVFYWLAAAAVLLIAFLTITLRADETIQTTTNPGIVKTAPAQTQIENKAIVIDNKAVVTMPTSVLQKNEIVLPKEKPVVLKNKPAPEEIVLLTTNTNEPVINLAIDTSGKPAIAAIVQPKKLKLVHINEIDPPVNKNGLAQQEGRPYFPVTHPTKQVYTNASENNKKDKDNLIRIKLN